MYHQQLSLAGIKTAKSRQKNPSFKLLLHERIATYGVETITAPEILAALTDIPLEKLTAGIDECGLLEFAKRIDSLDITDTQRRKLSLVFELSRKIGFSTGKHKEVLGSSQMAGAYFTRMLSTKAVEEFLVALLNGQNHIIKTVTAFKGTVNETAVHVREIVKMALMNNAVSVVIAHNHPAGSSRPSQADIDTTKKLQAALATVEVKMLDHIIVCGDTYTSLTEQGVL